MGTLGGFENPLAQENLSLLVLVTPLKSSLDGVDHPRKKDSTCESQEVCFQVQGQIWMILEGFQNLVGFFQHGGLGLLTVLL